MKLESASNPSPTASGVCFNAEWVLNRQERDAKRTNTMNKHPEQMMEELFATYYKHCPLETISYAIYNEAKSQGHIVLANHIELIHFTNYQGIYAIKFAVSRDGEEVFFDTYREAIWYWHMPLEEFKNYLLTITL